jgi:arsenate reductase
VKKIYHLKTCNTCQRIIKDIQPTSDFVLQGIKEEAITVKQLEEMHALSGSYEALFNKRAKLYKSMDLKNQVLSETDFRQFLLDEYTFLKRPVFILEDEIFIGNSKKVIEKLKEKIG